MKVLGIAGSLRKASFNASLLRAAAEECPAGIELELESIRGVPVYDADLEARGVPPRVAELKDKAAAAGALLLVTPEYNNSIPGPFKNAIDWMSTPPSDLERVFAGKPVGLIGASPGRQGTVLSQTAWLQVFRALGLRPWFGQTLYVGGAGSVFDASGRLVDDATRGRLRKYMAGFAAFVA